MIAAVLRDEGHVVALASNGAVCLSLLDRQVPDVVLSDVMMPVMDGGALCQALSADPRTCTTPIVLMSAASNKPKIAGCTYTSFLAKPFDLDELATAIAGALAAPA